LKGGKEKEEKNGETRSLGGRVIPEKHREKRNSLKESVGEVARGGGVKG